MRGLGMVVNARAACILALATWAGQLQHHCTAAKLVGVYLTPHGSLAIEPELFPAKTDEERRQVRGLHEAAVKLGAEIDAADPEVLLVVTPHGIMDPKRYNLYYNPIARGRADIDFCKCPPCCHTMTLAIDVELAQVHGWGKVVLTLDASGRGITEGCMQRLERFLVEEWGLPVSGVSFMGPPGAAVAPIPLTFAEVVPTSFIAGMNRTELRVNEDDDEGFLSNKPQASMSEEAGGGRRAVVLALPSRRFHEPVEMMRELLDLGRALYHFLDSTSTRVAVLVSGDGAHTHDPDSAYGYTPEAQVYDDAIVEWIRSRLGHHILRTAASVVATAKSCGFTGWVLSHGIMQGSGSPATLWTSQLLTYSHPSYYGVLAAAFRPQPHTSSHRADGDRAARFWQVPARG